ncbi:MAG: DUF192 domain-containing protein [Gemmatimonadetes bacterium]|nr:DUF192 domain-containing protein [Gemmatimonadota bacterium]
MNHARARILRRLRHGLASAVILVAGACRDAPPPAETGDRRLLVLDSAVVRFTNGRDTQALHLELAVRTDQQRLGLMERHQLPALAGMLFIYAADEGPDAGFWMYRTRIPLDIAFLDSTGRVRAIRNMTPCPTTIPEGCPSYAPGVPYRYALELNAGYVAQHGIDTTSRLLLADLPARRDTGGR